MFERRWALTVLDQALEQLQREYEADDNGALFGHLKKVLGGGTEALSYAHIGADLDMNEAAVRKAAHRLRKRYRSVLREHMGATVDQPERIDEEIRDLFAALSS